MSKDLHWRAKVMLPVLILQLFLFPQVHRRRFELLQKRELSTSPSLYITSSSAALLRPRNVEGNPCSRVTAARSCNCLVPKLGEGGSNLEAATLSLSSIFHHSYHYHSLQLLGCNCCQTFAILDCKRRWISEMPTLRLPTNRQFWGRHF